MDNSPFYNHLYHKLGIVIEEDNMDMQEEYFHILDKIIDACVLLRYENNRSSNIYDSIDRINTLVLKNFKTDQVPEKMLKNLANFFVMLTDRKEDFSYYYEQLNKFYQIYTNRDQELDYLVTTDFYNEILNKQKDVFCSEQKVRIKNFLKKKLPYTDKMYHKLQTNLRFQKAFMFLRNENYSSLGLSKERIQEMLEHLHLHLSTIKLFKKEGNQLSSIVLNQFDSLFLKGELTDENLKKGYPNFSRKERKMILNQYHKILLPYLKTIDIKYDEEFSLNVDFNYNHYQIVNEKDYQDRLKKFVDSLSRDEMNVISDQIEKISFLFKLLPLTGYILDFDEESFKNVVMNYDRICTKLRCDKGLIRISFDDILNYLFEVISLGRICAHTDRYTQAIFGQDVLDKIVNLSDRRVSSDPKDYVKVYHSMLECSITLIPPISGEFREYVYESGNNYDADKLLMGLYCHNSCLGVGGAGEEAYMEALTNERADVIFVRRKDNQEFYARILMFRKGNYIILAPIQGKYGFCESLYQEEFLSKIGNQLLNSSNDGIDSLDYILIQHTKLYDKKLAHFPIVTNECLSRGIPHCDILDSAWLIAAKDEKVELKVHGYAGTYPKTRKEVTIKNGDCNLELARVKALEIFREDDLVEQEILKNEFESILKTKYQKAYIGQDFYFAVRGDGGIEQTILKTNDYRQKEEISVCLDKLMEQLTVNIDSISNFAGKKL